MPGPSNFIWPFARLDTGQLGYDPQTDEPEDEVVDPVDWASSSNSGFIQVASIPAVILDDILEPDGTVFDGDGTAVPGFDNASNANDGDDSTYTERDGFATLGGTYTSFLEAHYAAPVEVTAMRIIGGVGNDAELDPDWDLYSSDDDVTYDPVTFTGTWNAVSKTIVMTLDTATTARYWRLVRTDTSVGATVFGPCIVWTWEMTGTSSTGGTKVWIPAPAVGDDDDATYDPCEAGDEVLRVFLNAERAIYRAELRIATETSGSKTYEIYGDEDGSFGTPTLLDSVTFTATGSYTAQEVTFEWVPTAAYRYYQIEGPTENRRFHDLNLYSALGATGGVSVHGALTGRDVADQHPAASLTVADAGGYFVDGTVEAILAEVGAGMRGYQDHGDAGATETVNFVTGHHRLRLTANLTLTFSGAVTGDSYWTVVDFVGDGTPRTLGFSGSTVAWQGGVAPTLDSTDGVTTRIVFATVDGGANVVGSGAGGGAGASALDDLTDVTITAPADGDTLQYNGSTWVNDDRHRAILTDGFDTLVWEGDDLAWEWSS